MNVQILVQTQRVADVSRKGVEVGKAPALRVVIACAEVLQAGLVRPFAAVEK